MFFYGKENIDIGGQGTGLNTNSYLAIYAKLITMIFLLIIGLN